MSKMTLSEGDYVRTADMTEEQYHAVAKEFIDAGAPEYEYPSWNYADGGYMHYFGWMVGGLFHFDLPEIHSPSPREITIAQALGEQEYTQADVANALGSQGAEVKVNHEDLRRARDMLKIAAEYIRNHYPDGIEFYDEADCDGYCIADDCESSAEMIDKD